MTKHDQWKASLRALSDDYAKWTDGVTDLAKLCEWNKLHSAIIEVMRVYYFDDAVEPWRVRFYKGARG